MTDTYRRIEFDIFHLYVSRPYLGIDATWVELTVLHEMAKELVEDI